MDGNDQEQDTAQKRKRGRPRGKPKSQAPPEVVMNIVEDDELEQGTCTDQKKKVTFSEDEETPKTPVSKGKRGRPRKSSPTPPRVPSGRKPGRPRKIVDNDSNKDNNGTDTVANTDTENVNTDTTDTELETPKRSRGRPRKAKTEASVESSVKRSRGRPRKHPPTPGGESSVKRSRGRPPKSPLSKLLHSSTKKRNRGRPPKTPLAQLLQATLVKKKRKVGRPRKNEKDNEDGDCEFVTVENIGMRTQSPAAKQRGRPPKHGSPSTRLGHTDEKKMKRSVEISSTLRSSMYLKSARQPPAVLPAQDDLMMEEVVRRFPFMDSVVKVFCIHTEPNFSLPWQMKRQFSSNSSGFIISGRRVLTNAHSVQHHTQVKVKKRGSDTKYLATVLAIGTECDIALLTVNNDEFWEGVPEVAFGGLPSLQDAVTVVGYPIGGDTISVTSGVVSRIEVTSYAHGVTELLGVQIDAAINAGNSGGPAFNAKGQCVGIAFQSLKQEDVENIGYIIPTPVISHFINDYERNGDYTGFPILGIEWQKMENPDLRKALGMESNQKGVLVRRVEPTAPAAKFLQPSDIILSFDDIDVANDGTVPFRHGERIGFSYLVSQKYTGEKAKLKIMRGTSFLEFEIQLETHKRLVPVHIKGLPPSYYIVAGIVFAAVSVPYLRSEYGKDYNYDAPVKLLDKLLHSMALSEDEQLVVISQVLVADINIGYEDIVNTQVLALNGVPVKNLKHLANMVENCEEQFMKFDLEYDQVVVLETKRAKEATPDILATHCIPSALSEDLK